MKQQVQYQQKYYNTQYQKGMMSMSPNTTQMMAKQQSNLKQGGSSVTYQAKSHFNKPDKLQ